MNEIRGERRFPGGLLETTHSALTGALVSYFHQSSLFPTTEDPEAFAPIRYAIQAPYSEDLSIYLAQLEMVDADGIIPGFDNSVRSLVKSLDHISEGRQESLLSFSATTALSARRATLPALVSEILDRRASFPKSVFIEALIAASETESAANRPELIYHFERALQLGDYTLNDVSSRALGSSRLNSVGSASAIRKAAKSATRLLQKTMLAVADDLETR